MPAAKAETPLSDERVPAPCPAGERLARRPCPVPGRQRHPADAPLGAPPATVRAWFDAAMDSAIPDADGTLATAQQTAKILARHAKADNTRRAYRAGVRAWCAWCGRHG